MPAGVRRRKLDAMLDPAALVWGILVAAITRDCAAQVLEFLFSIKKLAAFVRANHGKHLLTIRLNELQTNSIEQGLARSTWTIFDEPAQISSEPRLGSMCRRAKRFGTVITRVRNATIWPRESEFVLFPVAQLASKSFRRKWAAFGRRAIQPTDILGISLLAAGTRETGVCVYDEQTHTLQYLVL